MTNAEIMRAITANDARNIRDASRSLNPDYRTRQIIATDCAAHLVDAWDFGDMAIVKAASKRAVEESREAIKPKSEQTRKRRANVNRRES